MVDIAQLSVLDISGLAVIISGALLYFGKVVGDTKVERYDKFGYYIDGLYFSVILIILPLLLAHFTKTRIQLPALPLYFIQIFLLITLTWNFRAHHILRKHGLVGEFRRRMEKKLEDIKGRKSFFGQLIDIHENKFKKKYGLSYVDLSVLIQYNIPIRFFGSKLVLFSYSFVAILSTLYVIESGDFLFSAASIILTFFVLTFVGTAYGFGSVYYPPVSIHLENGEVVEGRLLKFGDFIYVLKGDEKIFVNRDRVKYFKESLFKEKSD